MTGALPPSVWVVILNFNGRVDTLRCLSAVERLYGHDGRIVVVDNGSADDSVGAVRRQFPEVSVIARGSNGGFSVGCNEGIRVALAEGADYVWLLNNDAVPGAGALRELVAVAATDTTIGAVGSVIETPGAPAAHVWGGGSINLWTGQTRHLRSSADTYLLDYITGASLLLRADALRHAGLLDERFFLYFEDTELGIRFRKMGWKLGVAEASKVTHVGGASSERVDARQIARYRTDSLILLLRLHAPVPVASWILSTIYRTAASVWSGRWRQAGWIAIDSLRSVVLWRR